MWISKELAIKEEMDKESTCLESETKDIWQTLKAGLLNAMGKKSG